MNWSHFFTLLWVRWRITVNHLSKAGWFSAVVMAILSGAALIVSAAGFFVALVIGMQKLEAAPPEVLAYLCDGWILAFLFFWMIGLVNELQRAEMLSIDKLLHLPSTLTEVFLFNFLSSLVTLTALTFVPPMLGLSIAAVVVKGWTCLVMFPLLASLVLMISAVTYQFRGWLATVMQNKRRRQTIIVAVTMSFVVLVQVPNMLNMVVQQRLGTARTGRYTKELEEKTALQQQMAARKITPQEYFKQATEIDQRGVERRKAEDQAFLKQVNGTLDIVNLVLPIGWMAYGTQSAAHGNPWPGIAGTLGLLAIASISLRRSYFTTLRYFTGGETGAAPAANPAAATTAAVAGKPAKPVANWLERALPFVSEPVAAVAWGTLRSMSRAPEIKMTMLGPVFVLFVYGSMMMSQRGGPGMPDLMRSFIPLGILGLSVAGVSQLSHNSFAFDRAGFRAYVLSGVRRWEILLGKNLALVPLVGMLTLPVLLIVQIFSPAPWLHFAATLLEIPSALILLALVGNTCSIYSPICQPAGSMKPNNVKILTLFVQFLFGLGTLFVLGVVTALPLGLETLLRFNGLLSPYIPLALLIALLELAVAIGLYLVIIRQQGKLLQASECRILDVVTQRGE